MTIYNDLQALIGKDIEFLKPVEVYVETIDGGMRATVLHITDDMDEDPNDPCLQIHFTLAKFEDYNRAFEQKTWYNDKGEAVLTAREAGYYEVETSIYVGKDWQQCLKLVDDASAKLFDLFTTDKAAQPDITYVKWLETLVLAAMPHLKSEN